MQAFLTRPPPRRGSRVGSTYDVPIASMREDELVAERKRLTIQAKVSFGAPPPPYAAWDEADGMFRMPRFYGLERYGTAERDDRVDGRPIDIMFTGTLTPVQRRAHEAVCDLDGSIICLPCGMGKTVLTVGLVAAFGVKTFVLVHKAVLRDQWTQAFERFCPGTRVGYVQGKTWDADRDDVDVVIGMIMTIAKRDIPTSAFDTFGLVVIDEAHHVAAPVTNLAMRKFNAKRIVGLTATKERPDGLTPLLHWVMGPEGFRAERSGEKVRVSVCTFPDGCREILSRDGKPLMAVMTNHLARNPKRNAFIADRIVSLRRAGRVLMVLSDRIDQLHALRALVLQRGLQETDVGLFVGSTREADRAVQLARPVVMCSYAMANEGVDKKEADTCVMATPKGRVIQCIGRVQRPCESKMSPLVVDVADDVSVYAQLRWKRQRLYSQEKYEVQVLPHDADPARWFV